MTFVKNVFTVSILAWIFSPSISSADFWLNEAGAIRIQAEKRSSGEIFWENFLHILSGKPPRASHDVSVLVKDASTGSPLPGTLVLLGTEEGKPFAENKKTTGIDGIAGFSAAELKAQPALSVTAKKAGYAVATIYSTNANSVEISLQPDPLPSAYGFLEGKFHGFPPGYNSRTLEMGVFLPAFRMESLLNFDPQQIVSSYKVTMDIYGERQIPGNVVFPPQDKRYIIFPVHLEKPEFIMPLPLEMKTHMSGIVGAVNLSDALDAMKNRDFLQILNLSTLTHVNWTNDRVTVRGNERFDLTINQAITQNAITSKYQNIPPRLDAVAITMVDPKGDGGDFVAVDVKSLKSESVQDGSGSIHLGKLDQNSYQHYIFSGFFDRNQFTQPKPDNGKPAIARKRAITGSIVKLGTEQSVNQQGFFQIIQGQSTANNGRSYRFSSANNPAAGIHANFLILNVYSEKINDTTRGRTRTLFWSVILPGNATEATLPTIDNDSILPPPDSGKDEVFYWEVIAVKGNANGSRFDTKAVLDNLEHLSNAVELF